MNLECIRCCMYMEVDGRKGAKLWGWLEYVNGWCCRYCKAEPPMRWIDVDKHPARAFRNEPLPKKIRHKARIHEKNS